MTTIQDLALPPGSSAVHLKADRANEPRPFMLATAALLEKLRSSERGLSQEEARCRLGEVGPNEPAPTQRGAGVVMQVLGLFANPLVLILLIASGVSAFSGEMVSASIIVVIVLLGTALNFVQTYRSQRAIERLRQGVAPTATVVRDGTWRELPRRELVPGDIIRLVAGDLVPADARLLEAKDLHVQQAALTGESMPVEKEAVELAEPPRQPPTCRTPSFWGLRSSVGLGLPWSS